MPWELRLPARASVLVHHPARSHLRRRRPPRPPPSLVRPRPTPRPRRPALRAERADPQIIKVRTRLPPTKQNDERQPGQQARRGVHLSRGGGREGRGGAARRAQLDARSAGRGRGDARRAVEYAHGVGRARSAAVNQNLVVQDRARRVVTAGHWRAPDALEREHARLRPRAHVEDADVVELTDAAARENVAVAAADDDEARAPAPSSTSARCARVAARGLPAAGCAAPTATCARRAPRGTRASACSSRCVLRTRRRRPRPSLRTWRTAPTSPCVRRARRRRVRSPAVLRGARPAPRHARRRAAGALVHDADGPAVVLVAVAALRAAERDDERVRGNSRCRRAARPSLRTCAGLGAPAARARGRPRAERRERLQHLQGAPAVRARRRG